MRTATRMLVSAEPLRPHYSCGHTTPLLSTPFRDSLLVRKDLTELSQPCSLENPMVASMRRMRLSLEHSMNVMEPTLTSGRDSCILSALVSHGTTLRLLMRSTLTQLPRFAPVSQTHVQRRLTLVSASAPGTTGGMESSVSGAHTGAQMAAR